MFAPQFSIRKLFLLTATCGIYSYLVSLAVQGHKWPIPFVIVGIAAVTAFALYAWFFLIAWIFSVLLKDLRWRPKTESPFATDRPAPQIVPPDHSL